jgi:MYND finger
MDDKRRRPVNVTDAMMDELSSRSIKELKESLTELSGPEALQGVVDKQDLVDRLGEQVRAQYRVDAISDTVGNSPEGSPHVPDKALFSVENDELLRRIRAHSWVPTEAIDLCTYKEGKPGKEPWDADTHHKLLVWLCMTTEHVASLEIRRRVSKSARAHRVLGRAQSLNLEAKAGTLDQVRAFSPLIFAAVFTLSPKAPTVATKDELMKLFAQSMAVKTCWSTFLVDIFSGAPQKWPTYGGSFKVNHPAECQTPDGGPPTDDPEPIDFDVDTLRWVAAEMANVEHNLSFHQTSNSDVIAEALEEESREQHRKLQQDTNKACGQCGAENSRKTCGGCRGVRYCSSECQRTHWKIHRQECANMKKFGPAGATGASRDPKAVPLPVVPATAGSGIEARTLLGQLAHFRDRRDAPRVGTLSDQVMGVVKLDKMVSACRSLPPVPRSRMDRFRELSTALQTFLLFWVMGLKSIKGLSLDRGAVLIEHEESFQEDVVQCRPNCPVFISFLTNGALIDYLRTHDDNHPGDNKGSIESTMMMVKQMWDQNLGVPVQVNYRHHISAHGTWASSTSMLETSHINTLFAQFEQQREGLLADFFAESCDVDFWPDVFSLDFHKRTGLAASFSRD